MKISVSIEVLWSLAAQEAVSVRFAEIEPEHFLEALLKVADMPADALVGLAPDPAASRCLIMEALEVQREAARLNLNGTTIRRELRLALGAGNTTHTTEVLHRSPSSRALFERSVRLMEEAGSDVLTPLFLFKAILAAPTPVISRVLGGAAGQAGATTPDEVPWEL